MKHQLIAIEQEINRAKMHMDLGYNKQEVLLNLTGVMDASLKSIVENMGGNPYYIDIKTSLELALEDE